MAGEEQAQDEVENLVFGEIGVVEHPPQQILLVGLAFLDPLLHFGLDESEYRRSRLQGLPVGSSWEIQWSRHHAFHEGNVLFLQLLRLRLPGLQAHYVLRHQVERELLI